MSAITHELRASYAFMERNFFLVRRYWTWELVWLAYSTANCLAIGYIVGLERWEGTIEYTLMAPIHRLTHMAGQTLFSIGYSLLSTGLVLVAATVAFDLDLGRGEPPR